MTVDALIRQYGQIPALSIKQPWAWVIVNGFKDIENRDWPTRFTGKFFVHTGKNFDKWVSVSQFRDLLDKENYNRLCIEWEKLPTGGIVGVSEIVDCVDYSASKWFVGEWGFVLKNSHTVDFVPLKGKLGFFNLK
jgi:hypothetical protein